MPGSRIRDDDLVGDLPCGCSRGLDTCPTRVSGQPPTPPPPRTDGLLSWLPAPRRRRRTTRISPRSATHPLCRESLHVGEGGLARCCRPADVQADRDRSETRPHLARSIDAIDIHDGRLLGRLRHEDAKAPVSEVGDVVSIAGEPPQRVRHGLEESVSSLLTQEPDETIEPVELQPHDGHGSPIPEACVLVGETPIPGRLVVQAGMSRTGDGRPDLCRVGGRRCHGHSLVCRVGGRWCHGHSLVCGSGAAGPAASGTAAADQQRRSADAGSGRLPRHGRGGPRSRRRT